MSLLIMIANFNQKFNNKTKKIIQFNLSKHQNLVFNIEKRINFIVQKQF